MEETEYASDILGVEDQEYSELKNQEGQQIWENTSLICRDIYFVPKMCQSKAFYIRVSFYVHNRPMRLVIHTVQGGKLKLRETNLPKCTEVVGSSTGI